MVGEKEENAMRKDDLTVPAILAEAVGLILGILYVGLQIYYGVVYHVAPYKFVCNIVGVILVYTGFTMMSCYPEKINRIPVDMCVGKVRMYSVRMVRSIKLVFLLGLMIPCVCDVAGVELQDAYSLFVIGLILLLALYYEYKIIRIMQKDKHDPNERL